MKSKPQMRRALAKKEGELPKAAVWPYPAPVHGKLGLKWMTDGTRNPDSISKANKRKKATS